MCGESFYLSVYSAFCIFRCLIMSQVFLLESKRGKKHPRYRYKIWDFLEPSTALWHAEVVTLALLFPIMRAMGFLPWSDDSCRTYRYWRGNVLHVFRWALNKTGWLLRLHTGLNYCTLIYLQCTMSHFKGCLQNVTICNKCFLWLSFKDQTCKGFK